MPSSGNHRRGGSQLIFFDQWLAEHFIKYAAAVHPLVMLVDGHSSHIDVNTSKFCKENHIFFPVAFLALRRQFYYC